MKIFSVIKTTPIGAFIFALAALTAFAARPGVELRLRGTYASGIYNQGASEIVAHDAATNRLFVVNGATSKIDVLSLADPSAPALLFSIDLAIYGRQANSVAVLAGPWLTTHMASGPTISTPRTT